MSHYLRRGSFSKLSNEPSKAQINFLFIMATVQDLWTLSYHCSHHNLSVEAKYHHEIRRKLEDFLICVLWGPVCDEFRVFGTDDKAVLREIGDQGY